MGCGDAGHILLSKRVADDLGEYEHWRPLLHDLGECEVKHGMRVSIVNLHADEVGNPQLPKKFQALKKHRARMRWAATTAAFLALAAIVAGIAMFSRNRVRSMLAVPEKSIAVMSFENRSRDPDNAFFANGIEDEILTRLAKIGALKVISRTSTRQYESNPGNLAEIAKQLGVANILEGSVQKSGDAVRVNVQLINARTDSRLWAETYDRKLIDIFKVETEVAIEIAATLQAKLDPEEEARLEAKPTNNSDAYVLYLKARDREGGVHDTANDFIAAEQLYTQAIALDPTFALAHARGSITNSDIFLFTQAPESKPKARAEAEAALRLAPDLAEAHLAMGLCLYWTEGNFDEAFKEFSIAATASPNNAETLVYIGLIYRRQGRWRDALGSFARAENLDPRNAEPAHNAPATYLCLRDWKAAVAGYNHLLEIAPDSITSRLRLACAEIGRDSNTIAAKATLQKIPAGIDPDGDVSLANWNVSMLERDFDAAEKILSTFPRERFDETPKSLFQGDIALARGDMTQARSLYENGRPAMEAQVRDHPDDSQRRAHLGLLYAYLGRKEDAIRESRRAIDLRRERKDAVETPLRENNLAMVYALIGETDQAIALIERLLSAPGAGWGDDPSMTLAELRLRWQWDPLRTDPRFKKILAGPEPKTAY
jgi:TolB-like protein/Flp pilus assembly protein TadD